MKRKIIIWMLLLFLSSCSFWIENTLWKKTHVSKNKKITLKTVTILTNLDLKLDSSITKYVDNKVHYTKNNYIPENLVNLKWDFLIDTKWNQKVRKITLNNLEKLSKDFYNTFNTKLKIVSAYRSYNYQKRIKDWGCSDIFCAKAGYSEHQSGLAIDFWEATQKSRFEKDIVLKEYFNWMKDNWDKYGFTNSYQKWVKIDWYAIEPWHWRYIWIWLAQNLKKQNITFAEFYYKNIKK